MLNKFQLGFKNREWAANVLAESIKDLIKKEMSSSNDIIVLGIPRGGVVTADIIAQKLNASFDIIIPRMLRAHKLTSQSTVIIADDGAATGATIIAATR